MTEQLHQYEETQKKSGFSMGWKMQMACWLAGMAALVSLGGVLGSQEYTPPAPNKVEMHKTCEITKKDWYINRIVRYYAQSSCGEFSVDAKVYKQLQVGAVYDLKTSQYQGKGEFSIVEATESSNTAP